MGLEIAHIEHNQFNEIAMRFYEMGLTSIKWSEKDEKILNNILDHLREYYVNKKGYPYVIQENSVEANEMSWLQSIKPQLKQQRSKKENNMSSRKLNNNEDVKEQIITPPEGYEIDKENNTFECIKFKRIQPVAWKDTVKQQNGFIIDNTAEFCTRLVEIAGDFNKLCIFYTEKQARSAIAMARISQIMANDERFGGVVTDDEWNNSKIIKYCIKKCFGSWTIDYFWNDYSFLAFHTSEQCQLFVEENEDLIKQYLMI